jgi:hypothetical protein
VSRERRTWDQRKESMDQELHRKEEHGPGVTWKERTWTRGSTEGRTWTTSSMEKKNMVQE